MSTLTTRLGLLKPAGSDPFLRTDFNTTWDTLDNHPGVFVCTSGSRPSWGVDQDGLLIFETDTSRLMQWDGDSWEYVRQHGNGYESFASFNDAMAPNSTINNKALGDITTTTPGSLMWVVVSNLVCIQGDVQSATMRFQIGGVDVHAGSGSLTRWAIPNANITGSPDSWANDNVLTGMTTIAAGTHSLRCQFTIGDGNQDITLREIRFIGWMVQGTGNH
jgi:hypothetical protein